MLPPRHAALPLLQQKPSSPYNFHDYSPHSGEWDYHPAHRSVLQPDQRAAAGGEDAVTLNSAELKHALKELTPREL